MSRNRVFEDDPEDEPQAPDDDGDAYEPLDLTQITEADLKDSDLEEG